MDKNREAPESIRGIKKNPKEMYAGFVFFWIFCLISIIIIISIISDEKEFDWWTVFLLIIPALLLGFGIWGILFTIRSITYSKKLYEHLRNWTMLKKKAIITKFENFRIDSENNFTREWYNIIAKIWNQRFKSEDINIQIYWAIGKDIDKKFYEKKGIPYSPTDPKYNNDYKKRRDAKKKEIDAKLDEIKFEYAYGSRFKKLILTRKINKLNLELIRTSPKSLPYKGKEYYIGDEITVLVDPDNPKNYIM